MAKTKVGTVTFAELLREAAKLERAAKRVAAVAQAMHDLGIGEIRAGYYEVYKQTVISVANIAAAMEEGLDEARLLPTKMGMEPNSVATIGNALPRMGTTKTAKPSRK